MKKKLIKGVSMFLVCLLVFSLLPGQLVASAVEAVEGAYTLLCEPKILGGFEVETYGNVAAVWENIYYDPISGQTFAGIKSNKDKGIWKPMHLLGADSSGVHAVSDWYQKITGLSAGGYAAAQNFDGKWGIIDSTGRVIVDFEYEEACMPNDDGYTLVSTKQGSWSTGELFIVDLARGTMYDASTFADENGFTLSRSGGTFTLYDSDLYQKYYAAITVNGYTIVEDRTSNSHMVVDENGNIIISDADKNYRIGGYYASFKNHAVSKEGLVQVQEIVERSYGYAGEDYGYINLDGELVIPIEYSSARDFRNGYAVVRGYGEGEHLIDVDGKTVTPLTPYYSNMSNASNTGVTWADSYGTIAAVYQVEARGSQEAPVSGPDNNTSATEEEYIYNTTDPGEDTRMDADRLNRVTDPASAAAAVRDMVNGMTQAQKDSPTGIDLATLYAETAVAKAASKSFTGTDILINAAAVADLETEAAQALTAVETALTDGGIATARYLSSTVTLTTSTTSEISIRIDPDILTTSVDKVRVEGPSYTLTFTVSELKEDLTDILTFKAEPVNTADAALSSVNTTAPYADSLFIYGGPIDPKAVYLANNVAGAVKVTLPGGSTSNPVTVSLPKDNSKDTTYQAVINSTGTATASKYNPATTNIDGKVDASGTYTVTAKEVNFTDITNKSAEMQKAIKYLASKGIISGTGGTNYSPDSSISRAEIAALLVRALGKLNSSATNSFTDVKSSDWYYTAAGSSQRAGYISGFEDNTFRGTTTINKEQIVAVAARVLINDMKYKTPSNTGTYLRKYSDTVASWAQSQVALATRENLVVYRTDGTFSGARNMTRGDAAIIIYRLFQKVW